MAICVTYQTILKASLSLSAEASPNSLVPLTIFDKAAFDLHIPVLYAFKAPMPSNEVLKRALSDALAHFPHLTGRFTADQAGEPCIVLNNAGIRLIETHVPIPLSDHLPFDPSMEVGHLVPPTQGIEELLQIQLNRYACGGLVIGHTAHHLAVDGQSMSTFFVVWDRLVRGLDLNLLPFHDRASLTVPRTEPRADFDHHLIEFQPKNTIQGTPSTLLCQDIIAHYSVNFLNKLKSKVMSESSLPHQKFSTFECLLAQVWKRVTQSRGLKLDQYTQVRVAVNGRTRIKPPVPLEYFGNLVLWAYPRLTVREVLMESHAFIANAIHDAVAKVDDSYFKSFIDFGELSKYNDAELEGTEPKFGNSLSPDLEVASWLGFQFDEINFGGGGLCAFYPPRISVEGLVIFLPSCREGGGVDVVMALRPEHARLFNQTYLSLE